jgi:hypothetical protein
VRGEGAPRGRRNCGIVVGIVVVLVVEEVELGDGRLFGRVSEVNFSDLYHVTYTSTWDPVV